MSKGKDLASEKGIPANIDTEKLVLGACLAMPGNSSYNLVASILPEEGFALHKHRLIFRAMKELDESGVLIDRVTVVSQVKKNGHLESIDGLSYLISLDDGLPEIFGLEDYVWIIHRAYKLRQIILASQVAIDRSMLAQDEPSAISASLDAALMELEDREQTGSKSVQYVIDNYEGGFSAFLDPTKRKAGIPTGFIKFDEQTGGLVPGRQYFLGARPGMGKSALMGGMQIYQAQRGIPTLAMILEMDAATWITRMACGLARVDAMKFSNNYLNEDERMRLTRALTDLTELPIYVDDNPVLDVATMKTKFTLAKQNLGIKVAYIDHLGLMKKDNEGSSSYSDVLALGRITRAGHLLAKKLDIAVHFAVQLSRVTERRGSPRPTLADFRGSGNIEEDADVAYFVFREEYYKPDREDLRGIAELILGKNRHGPQFPVKLAFLKEFVKFENYATDISAPAEEPPPQGGLAFAEEGEDI